MKSALWTALLLLPHLAFADPRNFIDQQKQVIRELDQLDIFPQQVSNDLARVRVEVPSSFAKVAGATRSSAFYSPSRRTIYLNPAADFSGELTTLVIHETLGAAGWLDVNYENSAAAANLLKDRRSPFLTATLRGAYRGQLQKIRRGTSESYAIPDSQKVDDRNSRLQAAASDGSGVVLVGGGGDAKAAQIKQLVVEKFNSWSRSNPAYQKNNARSFLAGLKVECVPSNGPFKQRLRVKSLLRRDLGYYERIFFVPAGASVSQAAHDIWLFAGYLGTVGSQVPVVIDTYVPRNSLEIRQFDEDPRSFQP